MDLIGNIINYEPSNFMEETYHQVWRNIMVEVYTSIMKNVVWDIVPRYYGKSIMSSRWLYKIKNALDADIEKCKVRFVEIGFSEKEVVDYDETFSRVARYIPL